ncbi:adenylate/guanylate cyclase domain-containing protein [Sulfitobacter sp. LCG007]
MSESARKRLIVTLAGALLAAGWAWLAAQPQLEARAGPADGLEAVLTDFRLRTHGPAVPADQVVVVAIDDASLADPDFGALEGRQRLARLIGAISAAGPRVIGLDVILADPGTPEGDAALADALAGGPVVIGAAASFGSGEAGIALPRASEVLSPQPRFAAASEVGLVNLATDVNGTPRHVPMVALTDGGLMQSMALRVASRTLDVVPRIGERSLTLGDRAVPLDAGAQMPLRLLGPAGTVPTIPALSVLSGDAAPALAGKSVMVGFTATAFGDRFLTPYGADTPGVEIIATAIGQLVGAPNLRRDGETRRADAAIAVALAAASAVSVLLFPLVIGVPLALGLLVATLGAVWTAFGQGLWLSAALPLLAAGPVILLGGSARHLFERRQAQNAARAMQALKRFQSPALADLIANDPEFLIAPQTRDLIVFFCDLSGFTALSQTLGPAQTQAFLKRFHNRTTDVVEKRGGVVLNYMGDGAMAVFGLRRANRDAANEALSAAFDLVAAIAELRPGEDGPGDALACRIGIHSGPVILSRLGGERQHQVTVTGDTVNLASRLMEVAKGEGASIAVTSDLLGALGSASTPAPHLVRTVPVRGRRGVTDVHLWRP